MWTTRIIKSPNYCLVGQSPSGLTTVKIIINTSPRSFIRAIVDTGSAISIVDEGLVDPECIRRTELKKIVAARGTPPTLKRSLRCTQGKHPQRGHVPHNTQRTSAPHPSKKRPCQTYTRHGRWSTERKRRDPHQPQTSKEGGSSSQCNVGADK
ncbi:hypothetical protein M8J76_011974 [Diaphorina citri]|nr:hypothetical protein M8J76_011974 [Diaphorina citri]